MRQGLAAFAGAMIALVTMDGAPGLAQDSLPGPRPRTRIEVRPSHYGQTNPGPYAQRDCVSWLQPENRPSGPVITPQMRCRWVQGNSTDVSPR